MQDTIHDARYTVLLIHDAKYKMHDTPRFMYDARFIYDCWTVHDTRYNIHDVTLLLANSVHIAKTDLKVRHSDHTMIGVPI